MIDVKLLEKDPEFAQRYKESLVHRGVSSEDYEKIHEINKKRKKLISEAETLRADQNKISKDVAKLKKEGEDATQL